MKMLLMNIICLNLWGFIENSDKAQQRGCEKNLFFYSPFVMFLFIFAAKL